MQLVLSSQETITPNAAQAEPLRQLMERVCDLVSTSLFQHSRRDEFNISTCGVRLLKKYRFSWLFSGDLHAESLLPWECTYLVIV